MMDGIYLFSKDGRTIFLVSADEIMVLKLVCQLFIVGLRDTQSKNHAV